MRKPDPNELAYDNELEAIRANDEKALEQLYAVNFKKVERFVIDNSGSADEAKDIFQEAFIIVWRNVQLGKVIQNEATSLNAYLFQVAKFKWLDYLRSSVVKKTTILADHHQELMTFDELDDIEAEQLVSIKKGFLQLGDKCRKLLAAFYYKKQPLKSIAVSFGWTDATAKNNKYRCLEKLRESIINKTSQS